MKKIFVEFDELGLAVLSQSHFDFTYNDGVLFLSEDNVGTVSDIARGGIAGGYTGWISCFECASFYLRHKSEIIAMLLNDCEESCLSVLTFLRSFGCLNRLVITDRDVVAVLLSETWEDLNDWENKGADCAVTVANALAWYVAEHYLFRLEDKFHEPEPEPDSVLTL